MYRHPRSVNCSQVRLRFTAVAFLIHPDHPRRVHHNSPRTPFCLHRIRIAPIQVSVRVTPSRRYVSPMEGSAGITHLGFAGNQS
jgi:hypothetical protein